MKTPSQSTATYDISTGPTQVVTNASLPWNLKTPSSLRFGIQIMSAPRTVSKVDDCDVNTGSDVSDRLVQSCSDYNYSMCKCNTPSDCSNCTLQSNYLSKLLSMGTSVELWASGYTSQSDRPMIPALLKIKTANGVNTFFETIPLPAIPLQKWTVVTIVQEGRRIDVYYGAKAVAGLYLKYPPVPAYVSDSWYAGGLVNWSGKIGLFSSTLSARTSSDVEKDVSQILDTTGIPYSQNVVDMTFDMGFGFPCLFGTCGNMPTVKPPNPFTVYESTVS
jgi:hypothetical protein